MPERSSGDRADRDHLDDVPDSAGCTGLWDHLSERRGEDHDDYDDDD